jgi:hypothetical protein
MSPALALLAMYQVLRIAITDAVATDRTGLATRLPGPW